MPKRSAEHLTARRERIAAAAEEVLVRDGVEGFSTTAVCRAARVSMGNLYSYFPSKGQLLDELVARAFAARAHWVDADSLPALRARLVELVDYLQTDDGRRAARLDIELGLVARTRPRPADTLARATLHGEVQTVLSRVTGGRTDPAARIAVDGITSLIAGWTYLASLGQQVPARAVESLDVLLELVRAPERPAD